MNNKESELNRILENVVKCCTTEIDGVTTITSEDLLGKRRVENLIMTRCILVGQILAAGYSVTTVAAFLHRSPQAIRHLCEKGNEYERLRR